jgi:hypothetical protein
MDQLLRFGTFFHIAIKGVSNVTSKRVSKGVSIVTEGRAKMLSRTFQTQTNSDSPSSLPSTVIQNLSKLGFNLDSFSKNSPRTNTLNLAGGHPWTSLMARQVQRWPLIGHLYYL